MSDQEQQPAPSAESAAMEAGPKPPAKDTVPAAAPSPRRPAGAPAGPSLAERIAALQKSTADKGHRGGSSSRSASASYATLPRTGSSLGPKRIASGSVNGSSSDRSTDSAATPLPVAIKNSAAVKDRLARFQTPDKPLIPRSSFGSPAPMQKETKALRPYPGAAGAASGQWGEGVLRPQMTGGAFYESRQGASSDVRPQLTGSAWLGVGGSGTPLAPAPGSSANFARPSSYKGSSSPNSLLMRSRSPIGNRDAFQELDDEQSNPSSSTSPTKPQAMRRGSSFTEAQMAAASMGLRRASRSASNDGTADSAGTSSVRDELDSIATTLADHASVGGVEKDKETRQLENGLSSSVTASPIAARRHHGNGAVDGSIDRGRQSEDAGTALQDTTARHPTGLLAQIRSRAGEDSIAESSENSSYDAAAPSVVDQPEEKGATVDAGPSASAKTSPVPRSPGSKKTEKKAASPPSFTRSQSSDIIESRTSPKPTTSITPSESLDRMASRKSEQSVPSITTSMHGQSSYISMRASESSSSIHSASSQDAAQRAKAAISAARARSASKPPTNDGYSPAPSPTSANGAKDPLAGAKAGDANNLRRGKPGSIRRPAPGRIMTPAEMDASDDEYEPGWASVTEYMSTSRIR